MEIRDGIEIKDSLGIKAGVVLSDGIKLVHEYNLHAVMRDLDGNIVDEQWSTNQLQTDMKAHVADQLSDQGEAAMGWMAIGTGIGQAVGGNTLVAEIDRRALDNSTPSHVAAIITYHRTFAAGEGTGLVTEAGLLNANVAGTMGLYDDTIVFNKTVAHALELTWTLAVN